MITIRPKYEYAVGEAFIIGLTVDESPLYYQCLRSLIELLRPHAQSVWTAPDELCILRPSISISQIRSLIGIKLEPSLLCKEVLLSICYHPTLSLDIQLITKQTGIESEEVIHLHSQATYYVTSTGFLPGFSYWGGLHKSLNTDRLSTPRPHVKAGSVGIGGSQSGAYGAISPGGWNIIGATPQSLWREDQENSPSTLSIGDIVKIKEINLETYNTSLHI